MMRIWTRDPAHIMRMSQQDKSRAEEAQAKAEADMRAAEQTRASIMRDLHRHQVFKRAFPITKSQ